MLSCDQQTFGFANIAVRDGPAQGLYRWIKSCKPYNTSSQLKQPVTTAAPWEQALKK